MTSEYSLYCSQGHLKEFVQALTLFAASVTSSVIMMFQNRFGSKHILLFMFACIALPGFVCVMLVEGLAFKIAGITGLWAYLDLTLAITPVYANELLVEPFRNVSNSGFRIAFSIGAFFGTLMTVFLPRYKHIVCLYFSGHLVNNLLLLFWLPRSPSYLLKQNKTRELTQTVAEIASVSGFPGERLGAVLAKLDSIVRSDAFWSPNL